MFLLVGIILVVAVVGIGYVLISNGTITQRQILNTVGLGTGEISIANLSDDSLDVTLTPIGTPGSDTSGSSRSKTVGSFEIGSISSIQPGRYELNIPRPSAAGGGICKLKIDSGDLYNIAVVRTGIVISRDKEPAKSDSDLDYPASPLCNR